ncbi:hypothetical protein AEM51_12180 [Bacteroidetes bacterium UKL13-3]|jgi:hypothetical protein|nr:hypothetical protein AEM51_12180 [Bacteroidetes bacterium UKL13-3]
MIEKVSMTIVYAPFLLFVTGLFFYIINIVKLYRQDKLFELKLSKEKFFDFAILVLRWYLSYYMFDYGWGKMTGDQFGHRSVEILNTPLKDVDKFHLAWYLFSLDKTFDIVIGLMQIIGAVLIVVNRTVLVGALLLLPILGQIFLVDLAFTSNMFGAALPIRLVCMILSDLLILFYHKDRMILIWNNLTKGTTTKFKYKWWVFILLPLLGLLTDFGFATLTYPFKLLINLLTK